MRVCLKAQGQEKVGCFYKELQAFIKRWIRCKLLTKGPYIPLEGFSFYQQVIFVEGR